MRYLLAFFIICAGSLVQAAPAEYRLEPDRSIVGFEVDFENTVISGNMPVSQADLTLDFDSVAASKVRVTLNPDRAQMDMPFATMAMKGRTVLNTRAHPTIRFESTSARKNGPGAIIEGLVTIRGVTRPVTLNGQVYRQPGTEPGERDRLSILLTGAVSRSAFGASGWPDLVGDEVRLRILARIRRLD